VDFGIPWYQVDDLRLALQWMEVSLPVGTEALHYFAHIEEKPHLWQESPENLRDRLIAVGAVLDPAIAAVIDNHVSQDNPIVIEGDGILPSLLESPHVRRHVGNEAVRMVLLAESSEQQLLANMRERNRGHGGMPADDVVTEARAKWLFAEWLEGEAGRRAVPIVASRPRESVVERVLTAASQGR
jgi:hypothetical protein